MATIVAVSICAVFDWVAAYSILLGGITCLVPSAFMAWRMLRETADPGTAVGHMVMAEAGKLAITATIFIAIFVLVEPLHVLAFFGTFIGLQAFYILVPIFYRAAYGQ